jgi:hypothetical protein
MGEYSDTPVVPPTTSSSRLALNATWYCAVTSCCVLGMEQVAKRLGSKGLAVLGLSTVVMEPALVVAVTVRILSSLENAHVLGPAHVEAVRTLVLLVRSRSAHAHSAFQWRTLLA